jgi:ABC-2 type transport system ATP-binding protein
MGLLLITSVLLSACSHFSHPTSSTSSTPQSPDRKASAVFVAKQGTTRSAIYYDVDIKTFDGILLKATVFQPKLAPGQTAPVVIHSHSFGVYRMSGPRSLYARNIVSGQAALAAWKAGYWVVSYDQRGHGSSGGRIEGMSPEFEVRDLSVVINWVEKNLHPIAFYEGDPLIGMVGESYAGSLQLLGSVMDPRIDAIVPITTWYDIHQSIAPANVPKTGWLSWLKRLTLLANGFSPIPLDPEVYEAYTQAQKGHFSDAALERWDNRSLKHFCDQQRFGQADVLLIQGFRDVLFPMNEAARAFNCLEQAGVDVRLLGLQGGHLLPFTQASWGLGFTMEENIHCNGKSIPTTQAILAWFDEKLKRLPQAACDIPKICLTQDVYSGVAYQSFPMGGPRLRFDTINIDSGMAGRLEKPLKALDWLLDLPLKLMPEHLAATKQQSGHLQANLRPAFAPLMVAGTDKILSGIPFANLYADTPNPEQMPVVFVGIGIQHKNQRYVRLISDQIVPVRMIGQQRVEMAGISTRVRTGDVIGLVVYGYNTQFANSGMAMQAQLSGSVELPIQSLSRPANGLMQASLRATNSSP